MNAGQARNKASFSLLGTRRVDHTHHAFAPVQHLPWYMYEYQGIYSPIITHRRRRKGSNPNSCSSCTRTRNL